MQQPATGEYGTYWGAAAPNLLLPAGTDIRDPYCGGVGDLVEVPEGTGRWYVVILVDDVGKGFDNEYRLAAITKVSSSVYVNDFGFMIWPSPIP